MYVLGQSGNAVEGARTLEAGEKVSLQSWQRQDGSPVIPFFTSLAALQNAIEHEASYMAFPTRAFFELTKGSALVLNPKSHYGKEFSPGEIDALLSGGLNRVAEAHITRQPTQVLLGQPAAYPAGMAEALTKFMSKRGNVAAAYLAMMHDPSRDQKPHLLVGIEADGDVEKTIREAGVVAADTAPARESVDLVEVKRGDEGVSEYFIRDVKPFYERR